MRIFKSLLAQWRPTSPVFTTSSPGLFRRLIFKGKALGTRLRFLSTGCRTAIIRAESSNQDGRPMLTYWSTRLCSRWRRNLSQRSNCWGFVFLLLWPVFFSHIVNSGVRLSGLRAFRSFGLKFRFAFCSPLVTADRWSTVCPCEFDCGARYCQFVYILCAGRRHQQLFNLRVLSRTKNFSLLVSLMAILPFEPHTLTLFTTKIADFLTLFKTEFRFLISCLRHLSRNHTLCKTIINIETFSYLIHWQSQNYF